MVFYVAIDGTKSDSLSHFQVEDLIESGAVKKSTLAWSPGMEAWRPLGEFPEFERIFDPPDRESSDETTRGGAGGGAKSGVGRASAVSKNSAAGKSVPPEALPAPWMRLFARGVDIILLFGLEVGLLSLFPGIVDWATASYMVGLFAHLVMVILWCLLEALFLSTWGYTPGKSLFRIKVRSGQGEILSYKTALQRSLLVWVKGLALMLVWVTPVAMMIAHARLMVFGMTTWDRDLRLQVTHRRPGQVQSAVAILIYLAYAFLIYKAVVFHYEQREKEGDGKSEKVEPEFGEGEDPGSE